MDNEISLWLPILATTLMLAVAIAGAVWLWRLHGRAIRSEEEVRELAELFVAAYQPPERQVEQENLKYILRKARSRCPNFAKHTASILDEIA